MLASDWMKTLALLVYLLATAWVLSQCDRILAPADRKPPQTLSISDPAGSDAKSPKETPAAQISEEAKMRAENRKAHWQELARRRARYLALEADLADMIKNDLPAALAELASNALRYRTKLSDLKRLSPQDRWDREAPVKEAHARARALSVEWHRLELEAEKGREGPTLHNEPDMQMLAKRMAAFKRGGEEIEPFAAALAPLHGKVPEAMLLAAIDAVPRGVLPGDAFDPCRDPAACPKDAVAEPAEPETSTYCITPSLGRPVTLLKRPELAAFMLMRLAPGQCGLLPTGRKAASNGTYGYARFIEVEVDGRTGWIGEGAISIITPSGSASQGMRRRRTAQRPRITVRFLCTSDEDPLLT